MYEGKVEVRAVGGGAENAKAVRLGENESARVEVGKDRVARVVREAGQPSPFVRQMPRRVRIKMFNTGVNLKVGDPDPHWQLVARSDDPKFKPRPAMVTSIYDVQAAGQSARPFAMDIGGGRHVDAARWRRLHVPHDVRSDGDAAVDGRVARAIRGRQPRAGDSPQRPRGSRAGAR